MKSLDELYLSCRDEISKEYINEAINSYKAGCYRASIVSTWIALVYDFIGKLKELSITGSSNAKGQYDKLEEFRVSNNINGILDFERNLLDKMKNEYDLLSPIEYDELKRLNADRNKCAHPSLITDGIPFQASAEIARYHIRNVIEYALSRPPVQGQHALNSIMTAIDTLSCFDSDKIVKQFINESPLGRAKDNLKVSFLYELKARIISDCSDELKAKYLKILKVFAEQNYELCREKFICKVFKNYAVIDKDVILYYIAIAAKLPEILENTSELIISQFIEYIKTDAPIYVLAVFYDNSVLGRAVNVRIGKLSDLELVDFLRKKPIKELMDKLIRIFENSWTWSNAAYNFSKYIIPITEYMDRDQINHVIHAILTNSQIKDSFEMSDLYLNFCEAIKIESIDEEICEEFLKEIPLCKKAADLIKSKCPKLNKINMSN